MTVTTSKDIVVSTSCAVVRLVAEGRRHR